MTHTNPVVLIAEDTAEVATIIQLSLRKSGLDFVHVTNGMQVLDYLQVNLPDLIILDIGLPGMDGWTVLEAIRSEPALDHIPIVVLTAHADAQSRKTGMLFHVDAYLAKPVTAGIIRETVEGILGRV